MELSENMHYLCTDKSRPLPIRTAYPAGHFLYIDMRYTKQAMTLAQQILTLQGRGLMIADTNKAEQSRDVTPSRKKKQTRLFCSSLDFS